MKLWLSKNSEVPVREQIVTQIKLGIAGGDLAVGDKLPSTAEISRRFKIHSNTVSNAYQILAEQGWLEFKKGSGFYVCENLAENSANSLDKLIAQFVQTTQNKGFTLIEIKARMEQFFKSNNSNRLIVIEDDEAFREILIEEINDAVPIEIVGVSFNEFEKKLSKNASNFVAMLDEKAKISAVLPPEKTCVFLKANSASASMTGETRPSFEDLIAVVSGWENFLIFAKTMLIAARIEPESLIIRSTKEKEWQNGLKTASMIICDSLTAKKFSDSKNLRIFRIISDESLNALQRIFSTT